MGGLLRKSHHDFFAKYAYYTHSKYSSQRWTSLRTA